MASRTRLSYNRSTAAATAPPPRKVRIMKKRASLLWLILPWLLLALACRLTGETLPEATPIPLLPPPDQVETTLVPPSDPTLPPSPLPPDPAETAEATALAPGTPVATPTSPPSPTATGAAPSGTASATTAPTAVPQTGDFFGPGQQDRTTLEPGGFRLYNVLGAQFQPLLFFAETADDANLLLATIAEDAAPGSLADIRPLAQADFSPAARPEILIYSPDADGPYRLLVGNQGPARGETAVYVFDAATDAPLATHYRGESLAPGENKQYAARSNGGRPVIAFVDPLDQSDLVLRIKDANGAVLTEANFSGPGSAESAFVLPLRATDYVIEVGEVNGRSATFTLVVIRLD
jgi:hypothetical protein